VLVLAEVEARRLPLLAICFGVQIWNVARGGTLIQDISSQWPGAVKHEQGEPRGRRSHSLRLLEGGLLAELAGGCAAQVNSHHHQAIERLGSELRATAWSPDGLVEGIEDVREDRWAVGVQWHPEIDWRGDEFSVNLFGSFLEAARAHASTRHRREYADA
jgi:putative glutamine amidotransferase